MTTADEANCNNSDFAAGSTGLPGRPDVRDALIEAERIAREMYADDERERGRNWVPWESVPKSEQNDYRRHATYAMRYAVRPEAVAALIDVGVLRPAAALCGECGHLTDDADDFADTYCSSDVVTLYRVAPLSTPEDSR